MMFVWNLLLTLSVIALLAIGAILNRRIDYLMTRLKEYPGVRGLDDLKDLIRKVKSHSDDTEFYSDERL